MEEVSGSNPLSLAHFFVFASARSCSLATVRTKVRTIFCSPRPKNLSAPRVSSDYIISRSLEWANRLHARAQVHASVHVGSCAVSAIDSCPL